MRTTPNPTATRPPDGEGRVRTRCIGACVCLCATLQSAQALITSQPASQAVLTGQVATITVSVDGPATGFQWIQLRDPAAPADPTNEVVVSTDPNLSVSYIEPTNCFYRVVVTQPDLSGTNYEDYSDVAVLTVLESPGIGILKQPEDAYTTSGSAVAFTVEAISPEPLGWQWYGSNGLLMDETNNALLVPNATTSEQGDYYAVLSSVHGSVTSQVATLTIDDVNTAWPQIVQQPASIITNGGEPVTFTVSVISDPLPLTYQWYLDGTELVGETNAEFTIPSVDPTNAGAHHVIVANPIGAVASEPAQLTVWPTNGSPYFTAQPVGVRTNQGADLTLTASAGGDPTLEYQWFFNGIALAGQTSSDMTLTNLEPQNTGGYWVSVSNSIGNADSAVADVLVNPTNTQPVISMAALSDGQFSAIFTPIVAETNYRVLYCDSLNSSIWLTNETSIRTLGEFYDPPLLQRVKLDWTETNYTDYGSSGPLPSRRFYRVVVGP